MQTKEAINVLIAFALCHLDDECPCDLAIIALAATTNIRVWNGYGKR